MTSEQIREKRRVERAQFKLDRARAIASAAAEAEALYAAEGKIIPAEQIKASIPSAATWKPSPISSDPTIYPAMAETIAEEEILEAATELPQDVEHLQLTFPEAFFLIWTMDCLTVINATNVRYCLFPLCSTSELWDYV
jgi:tRNA-splicing endonuclease subunit Sen2